MMIRRCTPRSKARSRRSPTLSLYEVSVAPNHFAQSARSCLQLPDLDVEPIQVGGVGGGARLFARQAVVVANVDEEADPCPFPFRLEYIV